MKTALALLLTTALIATAGAADDRPTAVVKGATEQLQAQIRAHRNEYEQDRASFYRAVNAAVTPAFDLGYTSQLVLGKYWRSATPDQRARFQAAFAATLINTYGDALLDRGGSTEIRWLLSSIDALARTAAVRANATTDGPSPLTMLFALRLDDANRWLVYDITFEGVSLVTSFRSQFVSEVRASGLDALIARLQSAQNLPPASALAQAR
jgi:phospholipid transport system substrate-binding protein